MQSKLLKIEKNIANIEEALTQLLIAAIVLLVFFVAIVRWSGFPVAWSVEISQLLFVWLIFLGADQALRNNRHIGIDVLTSKLSDKVQVLLSGLIDLLIALFLIFMIYYGIQHSLEHSLRSIQNLPISYSYATSSVPTGCTLMLVTILIKWLTRKEKQKIDQKTSYETQI